MHAALPASLLRGSFIWAALILPVAVPLCGGTLAQPAEEGADLAQEPCLEIRYNPPPCDCIPFELLQGVLWSRVYLVDLSDNEDLLDAMRAAGRRAAQEGRIESWRVVGRVTERTRRCALGHAHLVVELSRVCPPEESAPHLPADLDETPAREGTPLPEPPAGQRSPPGQAPGATPGEDVTSQGSRSPPI